MNRELARLIINLLIYLDVQVNLKSGNYKKSDLKDILALINDINFKHPKFENNIERKKIIEDVIDTIYQEVNLNE